MKQLEKFIRVQDFTHINIYNIQRALKYLKEQAIMNMRYKESLIGCKPGHGQNYGIIKV